MRTDNLMTLYLSPEESNVLLSALSSYMTTGDAAAASNTPAYAVAKTLRRDLMRVRSNARNKTLKGA